MSIEPTMSGHWTDDQLISHLYGVGLETGHLDNCPDCQNRFAAMQLRRKSMESSEVADEISSDFLAAQRRAVYARLSEPVRLWSTWQVRRWASGVATVLVIVSGLLVYENSHRRQLANDQVSDAQLALEVSESVQNDEPTSTAPLQALFDE